MDFHVGDVVRIRQWDDMAYEFGATSNRILCRYGFYSKMRPLCGMEFVISDIIHFDIFDTPAIVRVSEPKLVGYILTTDMIEPVECDSEIVETEEFSDFLEQYM